MALTILGNKLHDAGIEVRESLEPVLVNVNVTGLLQVFINIISNAIHAMQDIDRPRILTISSHVEGTIVKINFTDTGSGIDAAIQDKVMEPFFTTKPPGEGTGLGLFISQGIIEKMGGKITFTSISDVGTTFSVSLFKVNAISD
ncbi:MAG: sensor histidine kinase [Bacteroidota bacterium]